MGLALVIYLALIIQFILDRPILAVAVLIFLLGICALGIWELRKPR